MENTEIKIEKIKEKYNEILKKYSATIVEGAGGLFVPLIRDKFYIYDLIKLLNLPVVLVCGTRVGAINHTLLTVKALENMGIKIHGLIFNNYKNNFYEDDNLREILSLSKIDNYIVIKNGDKEVDEDKIKNFFGGLLNE
nr:MAG: dethiobiotin synthase [Fusobacteriales bacterium]